MLIVSIWDSANVQPAEKSIRESNLGLNPMIEGNLIRIPIPSLSEDRRKELVRVVHKIVEEGRISVRNVRRDGNDQLKKINNSNELSDDNLKRALEDIQEMTNKHIEEVNELQKNKDKEIME